MLCHDNDASPPPEKPTRSTSESENPAIPIAEPKAHAPLTNQDWWPDQVDVVASCTRTVVSNPYGEDFSYAEEFAKLDVEALKADVLSRHHHFAGLVARRLRQLRRPVHPDELACRRHLPHLRRPRRRRRGHAALRAAEQLAGQRQPGQGASSAVAGQAEVRQQDLLGRPAGVRRQRGAGVGWFRDLRLRLRPAGRLGARGDPLRRGGRMAGHRQALLRRARPRRTATARPPWA